MGRIGDSPDEQRIAEINEAQFRARADEKKRLEAEKHGKAFESVMRDRVSREQGEALTRKTETRSEGEQKVRQDEGLAKHLKKLPKSDAELSRRAALAKASGDGMATVRNQRIDQQKGAEGERIRELDRSREDERTRIDDDVRHEALDEAHRAEDAPVVVALDPDDRPSQKQSRREGEGEGGERAEGVAAAEGAKGAAGAKLPQQLLDAIAKSIAVAATASGTTEVRVELKGTMLEGVLLKVSVKKGGKLTCSFENCDKQTANLIEASKGDLMRSIAKKGLELDILRVR